MAELWGALGDIQFEIFNAPLGAKYSEKSNYVEQRRILSKPVLQLVGEELQKIALTFRFSSGWCSPNEELKKLQEARVLAEPMTLVLGSGRFQGNYVIEDIKVTTLQTQIDGTVDLIIVEVNLLEVDELPEPVLTISQAQPFEVRV
jgi:phage protein U